MKRLIFLVGLLLLCAVVAVAAASAAWIAWTAWHGDAEVLKALLGGFAGAFFAFLFVRIGEGLRRHFERQERNHQALLKAQYYLNDILGLVGDNIFVIEDFVRTMTDQALEGENAPVYLNRFGAFEIDRGTLLDLTNIDLVNDLYSLNASLRKLNDSIATADRATTKLTDAAFARQIRHDEYALNMKRQRNRYSELRGFLLQAKESAIRLLAIVQYSLAHGPFLIDLLRHLSKRQYSKQFLSAIPGEIDRVRGDMAHIEAASRAEIEAVAGRANQAPGG